MFLGPDLFQSYFLLPPSPNPGGLKLLGIVKIIIQALLLTVCQNCEQRFHILKRNTLIQNYGIIK